MHPSEFSSRCKCSSAFDRAIYPGHLSSHWFVTIGGGTQMRSGEGPAWQPLSALARHDWQPAESCSEWMILDGSKLLGMDDPEWFKAGGGSALGAFPMPLGSLTELLRPPALPGPFGIPLTPASAAPCANDGTGDIKQPAHARAKNVDLPNIDRSPVRVSNEAAGLPFPVRMRPNAGHGLLFSRKPDHVHRRWYRGVRHDRRFSAT